MEKWLNLVTVAGDSDREQQSPRLLLCVAEQSCLGHSVWEAGQRKGTRKERGQDQI